MASGKYIMESAPGAITRINGKDFLYFGDKNFIRLNFACRHSLVEEAVGRIRKAVLALNKKAD